MRFSSLLVASLGATVVLAMQSPHKRAKTGKKRVARQIGDISKTTNSTYLNNKTACMFVILQER